MVSLWLAILPLVRLGPLLPVVVRTVPGLAISLLLPLVLSVCHEALLPYLMETVLRFMNSSIPSRASSRP
jgi:hypothetical protein